MKNLKIFVRRVVILTIFPFLLLSPLFFYNLSGYTLVDFDEAWYGEIARNILTWRNPFVLSFNEVPYTDHPPLGFILIAISELIFGVNEFAVRFPSALCGFGSLILTFLIGKKLFSRVIGLGAMFILASSVWFILRSRQGDLDTILLFFYLLTLYLALKVKENYNFIFAVSISFALLLSTKSFFGLTIIPTIVTIFLIYRIKISLKKLAFGLIIFTIIIAFWLVPNYAKYKLGFISHIVQVGLKPDRRQPINFGEIHRSLTLVYLHYGIRKWYYPAIFSMAICTLFVFKHKNLLILYTWTLIPTYGFLTSSKTEIWHLIPIYPALALFTSFTTLNIATLLIKKLTRLPINICRNTADVLGLLFFVLTSSTFIFNFRNAVKLFGRERHPLTQVASFAKNYKEPLFITSDLTVPATAIFYSQKRVRVVGNELPPVNTIPSLLEFGPKPFLLITEGWRLKLDKVDKTRYRVLKQVADYQLLLVN